MPHQPSMFFKKTLLDRVGPINEELHFSIDLELWLQGALQTRYHHINRVLSCAVQRSDCKSEGTASGQIQSHWNVIVPFLAHLPISERIKFWSDYYIGRLNGLNCHAQLETTRFPDSEEALIEIQRPETRDMLIAAGNEQMRKFRWDTMAGQLQNVREQVLRATEERITSSPQP